MLHITDMTHDKCFHLRELAYTNHIFDNTRMTQDANNMSSVNFHIDILWSTLMFKYNMNAYIFTKFFLY